MLLANCKQIIQNQCKIVRRGAIFNVCWRKNSCEIFPLATTHAKVANSGSGKMVIAPYRIRYFFQKRAALALSLLDNWLVIVARYCPALSPAPWVISQKVDITRRTPEAAFWLGLGCWNNKVANSHVSPTPVNSRVGCCAPAWCPSSHTRLTDPAINDALRAVTGCLRPTLVDNVAVTLARWHHVTFMFVF